MTRLGVPVGGRVRMSRAVKDQSAPIPEEITSELGWAVSSQSKEKTPGTFYFLEHELSARLNSIAATFLKLLSATADTWLIRPW